MVCASLFDLLWAADENDEQYDIRRAFRIRNHAWADGG